MNYRAYFKLRTFRIRSILFSDYYTYSFSYNSWLPLSHNSFEHVFVYIPFHFSLSPVCTETSGGALGLQSIDLERGRVHERRDGVH